MLMLLIGLQHSLDADGQDQFWNTPERMDAAGIGVQDGGILSNILEEDRQWVSCA